MIEPHAAAMYANASLATGDSGSFPFMTHPTSVTHVGPGGVPEVDGVSGASPTSSTMFGANMPTPSTLPRSSPPTLERHYPPTHPPGQLEHSSGGCEESSERTMRDHRAWTTMHKARQRL